VIKVEFTDLAEIEAALRALAERGADLRVPLEAIGEALAETTKRRFVTSTAPDGARWMPNKNSTLAAFGSRFGAKSRGARIAGKKPLIGETKRLSGEINFRVAGNAVEIGATTKYAAVQQFGARRGEFGKNRRGSPIPWGNIPARPFLGLSKADEEIVLETLREHLDSPS
jgi:phage virion morphogenesis protein